MKGRDPTAENRVADGPWALRTVPAGDFPLLLANVVIASYSPATGRKPCVVAHTGLGIPLRFRCGGSRQALRPGRRAAPEPHPAPEPG